MTKPPRTTPASNIAIRRQNARSEGGADYSQKRDELLSIAATLFKENGFKATTLADVGERAKMDRATVYYYFGSKQELFQTCIEGSLDDNLMAAERLLTDKTLSPRDKIHELLQVLMRSYDSNYPQMYVYIQEQMVQVGNDPSKWAKEIRRKTRRFDTIMRELVEQGIAASAMRSDIEPGLAVNALFGMLNWSHRWYRPSTAFSPTVIADTFSKIFFEGMAAKR